MEFDESEMESPTVEMSVDMEMLIWKCSEPHFTEMDRRNIHKCVIDTLTEMFDMDISRGYVY